MAVFWPGIFILKTIMFCEVTTALNERKHLKMVIRSVPGSFSLILGLTKWLGLALAHCFTQCTTSWLVVPKNVFQMLMPLAGTYLDIHVCNQEIGNRHVCIWMYMVCTWNQMKILCWVQNGRFTFENWLRECYSISTLEQWCWTPVVLSIPISEDLKSN